MTEHEHFSHINDTESVGRVRSDCDTAEADLLIYVGGLPDHLCSDGEVILLDASGDEQITDGLLTGSDHHAVRLWAPLPSPAPGLWAVHVVVLIADTGVWAEVQYQITPWAP